MFKTSVYNTSQDKTSDKTAGTDKSVIGNNKNIKHTSRIDSKTYKEKTNNITKPNTNSRTTSKKRNYDEDSDKEKKKLKCDICHKLFNSDELLKEHKKLHETSSQIVNGKKCDQCSMKFLLNRVYLLNPSILYPFTSYLKL